MAVTLASDVTTTTPDTPQTLTTHNDPGVFLIRCDLQELTVGDVLVVDVSTKVTAEGSFALQRSSVFANTLAYPIVEIPPVVSMHGIMLVIEQTEGSARDIRWELIQIDAS